MNQRDRNLLGATRRHFLRDCSVGLGGMALGSVLGKVATAQESDNPLAPRNTHFRARAKNVIYLHMAGSPPHLDLLDYKPELVKHDGLSLSSSVYGSVFYLTTGFHGLHVTGGLIAFLLVIGRAYAVKNFGRKEMTSSIVVSYYWHFVDVVWIALFLVIYFLK